MNCVLGCRFSPACDGIWLSHCYRRLKKRAAEKVSRAKVNVSAGGRYTVYCSFGSGFPVGVENNHSVPAF